MNWYEIFLNKFFHDPIDKPFDIKYHENRAKKYKELFGISSDLEKEFKYADIIASCMERSLIPKDTDNEQIRQEFNEIRHPLSEGSINNEEIDKEKSIQEISKILEKISESYISYSEDKKSYAIWRNLLEDILNELKDTELQKYFAIIPADTRVPDHSLWEHLKITTATNAGEKLQNNSLFLFSLGPVQSFIKQARKTQDFYMGSFLLSYLTFIAIEVVIEHFGPTSIIYPDLYKQPLMDWYLKNKIKIEVKNFDVNSIQLPTIPNRFVAILGTTDSQEIINIAKEIKQKIKSQIEESCKVIFQQLNIQLNEDQNKIKELQLKDFPQIYWVAIPWRMGEEDIKIENLKEFYKEDILKKWQEFFDFAKKTGELEPNVGFLYQLLYTALEKSHGAIKNQRIFEQIKEEGRKCSLCGERNVLFFLEKSKEKFIKFNPDAYSLKISTPKKYFDEEEGLCAICFLKRTFEEYLGKNVSNVFKDFSFPSTAEVASSDFKERLIKEAINLWDEYVGSLSKIKSLRVLPLPKLSKIAKSNVEGQYFYEETLKESNLEKDEDFYKNDIDIQELKKTLKEIYKKIGKPNPYYAILYLDGDNMGKWLSGENLPEIQHAYHSNVWKKMPQDFKQDLIKKSPKKILTPAIHSAISTSLRNYTIEFVRPIVEEEHLGKLIYAGGDDVLAFVNLKDLFDVMQKLRWAFSGQIKIENNKMQLDLNNTTGFVLKNQVYHLTMGSKATCSMGVVIAHYKEPLQLVIDKVFEMEKKAKDYGRDSFAICLMKHSGEERVGISKWKIDGKENTYLTTELFKQLKEKMDREQDEYISDGFIQKFRKEFYYLNISDLEEGLVKTEIKRLISRAYNSKDSKLKKEKFINDFYKSIEIILEETLKSEKYNKNNFTNLLEIISFMNRGE
jgi:CRISPR-associated protein Cmr2